MDATQEIDLSGHTNRAFQNSQTELREPPKIECQQASGVNWLTQAQQRQQALTGLQSVLKRSIQEQSPNITAGNFCCLFAQENVLQLLFRLFDHESEGRLVQLDFVDSLKEKLRDKPKGTEFVDLLDTLWYMFLKQADINFETFCHVFKSRGVLPKLFSLIDTHKTGQVSIEDVMAFFTDLTLHRREDGVERLKPGFADELFRSIVKDDTREMSFEEFKKLIPSKNKFFAERIFGIFNKDGSSSISMAEFREGLEQFCGQTDEDKVRCLFQIYDEDGDGLIKLHELKAVLKACIEENGMKFSETQVEQLAVALYEDAQDCSEELDQRPDNGLTYTELKAQMAKHPGLLENLSISMDRFLLPPAKKAIPSRFTFKSISSYIKNNVAYIVFVAIYALINICLVVSRAIEFKDTNIFYILARAGGQALNFNCAFILVLMLRQGITLLRRIGCASYLPLDQHVYLHKACGIVVIFFSVVHTVMHLINFPLNIAGALVSPVTGRNHTAAEWLFTTTPGLFGLYPGLANITGWLLCLVLAIMGVCSLPSVRKGGYFEVFYWSHLLYIPFWILVLLHGPRFWYWFIVPGSIFIILKVRSGIYRHSNEKGHTTISSAVLLPSGVTHLVLKKPPGFHFNPGDYLYLKVPAITKTEWHPFTISSAPELPDYLWLHIRCAGGWTNKLYEFFEKEQAKQRLYENIGTVPQLSNVSNSSTLTRNLSASPTCAYNINPATDLPSLRTQSMPADSSLNNSQTRSPQGSAKQAAHHYIRSGPADVSISIPANSFGRNAHLDSTKVSLSPHASSGPKAIGNAASNSTLNEDDKGGKVVRRRLPKIGETGRIYYPLPVSIDGPYGAPSSHIFRAERAVLIAAGIGVTPFASILHSIMHRYYATLQQCPNCQHSWAPQMPDSIMNLKKVDFFWINRDQRSFEWFVDMLSQLEMEQTDVGGVLDRFLDLHMYITSALKKTDMKAVGLQMAFDLLYAKEKRDLVTGLKTRTNAGRPNWDKVFQKILDEDKGKVTVFYCGPPQLAKELTKKCNDFGFDFRKEIF
ncbi:hypothetical protein GHT06_007821 [Daphnia sinensis]|uniref:NADPH oxidase 5 n=1 Tax=Daphnia sinensis TaxID=1820382 RepID=A0AAD5LKN2_9CRUS|nr:hypothetical protein GHT06_007821 [Daphnia sinensis]